MNRDVSTVWKRRAVFAFLLALALVGAQAACSRRTQTALRDKVAASDIALSQPEAPEGREKPAKPVQVSQALPPQEAPLRRAADNGLSVRRTPAVLAIEKARPAVVNINTEQRITVRQSPFGSGFDNFFNDPFFHDMFQPQYKDITRTSLGSGFIVDPEKGYILTNEHVILQASRINVMLPDRREFEATLKVSDANFDLAVLQIVDPPDDLPSCEMGDSDTLMIGETAIAIGSPEGFEHTATIGSIGALNRTIAIQSHSYTELIQTDAAINPGNSGGPLISLDGKVMGINTAIYSETGANIGIGFAIPINRARQVMTELLQYGSMKRAWVGINVQNLTRELAEHFQFKRSGGALVSGFKIESPAREAGLQAGDVVVAVNDTLVKDATDFWNVASGLLVGQNAKLLVFRDGREIQVGFTVSEFPKERAKEVALDWLGLEVKDIGDMFEGDPRAAKSPYRVAVARVTGGSRAANMQLKKFDIVRQIGRMPITDMDDFYEAVLTYAHLKNVNLRAVRGNYILEWIIPS